MKCHFIALVAILGAAGCTVDAATEAEGPSEQLGTTQQALGEAGLIFGIGGQCVDVQNANPAAGTPVWMYPCNGSVAQQWRLTSNHEIRITGLGDKCLTAGTSGSSVYIGNCFAGWERQQWVLRQDGSIRSFDGRCLDVAWGGTTPQTPLVMNNCSPSLPSWAPQVFSFQRWKNNLQMGERLNAHQQIRSGNGVYRLIMQSDCNLVLYQYATPIWHSNTYYRGAGCYAEMQYDGNFVVYDWARNPLFDTATKGYGRFLLLQDDNNLVVYGNNIFSGGDWPYWSWRSGRLSNPSWGYTPPSGYGGGEWCVPQSCGTQF